MKNRFNTLLALLLLAGCAAAPTVQSPVSPVAYTPTAAPTRIAGSATLEVTYVPAPEIVTKWKRQGFKDKVIDRHRQDVVNALTNDLSSGALFTHVLPASADTKPNYIAKVQCRTVQVTTHTSAQITLTIINTTTGNPEWTLFREIGLGPINGPHLPLGQSLSRLMAALKSDLAGSIARKAKDDAELAEIAQMKIAPLTDLLVATDRNEALARERNRAIVAAKTQQLPEILRNWKTDQLSTLVVKIEQTILDLNHECEIAKDKAQQSVADGTNQNPRPDLQDARVDALAARRRGVPAPTGSQQRTNAPTTIESLRDLSISYRERIELLKPILGALKEEIVNRNR